MSDAITRKEAYLKSIGDGTSSALKPITREEQYLAYIAGESNSFPTTPITREEAFLDKIAKSGAGGGGSSINVQPLTVTENGTYDAPEGVAYSPVTVNVAGGGGEGGGGGASATIKPLTILQDGVYEARSGSAEYGKVLYFKRNYTENDFNNFVAKATPTAEQGGMRGYQISDTYQLMTMQVGDVTVWAISGRNALNTLYEENVGYYINAGAVMPDVPDNCWINANTFSEIYYTPHTTISEGTQLSADLETLSILFDVDKADAFAPIEVKAYQKFVTPKVSFTSSGSSMSVDRNFRMLGIEYDVYVGDTLMYTMKPNELATNPSWHGIKSGDQVTVKARLVNDTSDAVFMP